MGDGANEMGDFLPAVDLGTVSGAAALGLNCYESNFCEQRSRTFGGVPLPQGRGLLFRAVSTALARTRDPHTCMHRDREGLMLHLLLMGNEGSHKTKSLVLIAVILLICNDQLLFISSIGMVGRDHNCLCCLTIIACSISQSGPLAGAASLSSG
jgi:hypothetical protein